MSGSSVNPKEPFSGTLHRSKLPWVQGFMQTVQISGGP